VEKIYKAFGPDLASEPIDIDTLDAKRAAKVFEEYKALVVGAPTWNTSSDSERSGTGWDSLYKDVPSFEPVWKVMITLKAKLREEICSVASYLIEIIKMI
jgi:hypothetical protein